MLINNKISFQAKLSNFGNTIKLGYSEQLGTSQSCLLLTGFVIARLVDIGKHGFWTGKNGQKIVCLN